MEYQALLNGPIYLKVITKTPLPLAGVAYQLTMRIEWRSNARRGHRRGRSEWTIRCSPTSIPQPTQRDTLSGARL